MKKSMLLFISLWTASIIGNTCIDQNNTLSTRSESFSKKGIIKYIALGGIAYHLWHYKLEAVQGLFGAVSNFFGGSDFSPEQIAQIKILARGAAFQGGLLTLYGLMSMYDDMPDYTAALEIRRLIAQHKISKKEESGCTEDLSF